MQNPLLLHPPEHGTGVKICGLMDEASIDVALVAGADAIGFVFAQGSPRLIERNRASQLMLQLPDAVLGIAVLQNYPSIDDFNDWDGWIQMCGDEDEDVIAAAPRPVIRAFKWSKDAVIRWDCCPDVQALLVDGSTGGLGRSFDVAELAKMIPTLSTPIIIAGGLTPENVASVISLAHPTAVDVSSGVELSPGIKDPQRIRDFIKQVRQTT